MADAEEKTKDNVQVNNPNDEEKKEEFLVKRKDESAEWIEYLKPKYDKTAISNDAFGGYGRSQQPKINAYSHLFKKLKEYKCEYHLYKDGSVTFYPAPFLSNDKLGQQILKQVPFEKSKQYENIMKETKCDPNKLEACYDYDAKVIESPNDIHPFIAAIEIAYFKHYPLSLSVSQIWLLLLQSIGMHIDQNAEKLRKKFVKHEGKKDLIVNRPNFVKGSRSNKWDGVILEFVQQIDKNTIDDIVELLECKFSTTTITEKIAGKVAIMDIMKHYFNYVMMCGCGFPQITLKGTKQDWVNLKTKLKAILTQKVDKQFGANWSKAILPVIDRFIDVYDGKIDCLFWNSMLRRGATGASFPGIFGQTNIDSRDKEHYYTGWFNVFFPLLNPIGGGWSMRANNEAQFRDNSACEPYSDDAEYVKCGLGGGARGPMMDTFPSGYSSAPVKYIDANVGKTYNMKFIAGFIGCDQDEKTLQVTPKVEWLIGEELEQ